MRSCWPLDQATGSPLTPAVSQGQGRVTGTIGIRGRGTIGVRVRVEEPGRVRTVGHGRVQGRFRDGHLRVVVRDVSCDQG